MQAADAAPLLLVHGGAGALPRLLDERQTRAIGEALAQALRQGLAVLQDHGRALDAVVAAVTVLEDAPWFNAGRGAVYTAEGRHELDAAVMEGATLRAGSVAGVRCVRNPVQLAHAVLERSPHVMLSGAGADAFARQAGLPVVENTYFDTPQRENEWRAWQAQAGAGTSHYGTVGAVARDAQGTLAAATSTGGMTGKRWGRIGDSALIGAGTCADAHAAVSCTGWGEFFIRTCAAHAICSRIAAGETPSGAAAALVLRQIPALGGSGGAIVLVSDGGYALVFGTEGMYRGAIGADGVPRVAIAPGPLRPAAES